MSDDAVFVVNYIWTTFGEDARMFLVGYSAGSNIVQRTLLRCRQEEEGQDQEREEGAAGPSEQAVRRPRIWAAMCVCITYDYLAARQRLERSPVGAVYSMLMTHIYKVSFLSYFIAYLSIFNAILHGIVLQTIIQKNSHVHHLVKGLDSPAEGQEDGQQLATEDDDKGREEDASSSGQADSSFITPSKQPFGRRSKKSDGGSDLVKKLLRKATFLSDYDELCGRHLHKFSSQRQLQDALSMFQCRHIDVPMLAMQPLDDPLHAVGIGYPRLIIVSSSHLMGKIGSSAREH